MPGRQPIEPGLRIMQLRSSLPTFTTLVTFLSPQTASAIRPFVTDDARVVGDKLAQVETWALVDRSAFQHNVLAALGPTPWLEVTTGFIHGAVERRYSITGPILQLKALVVHAENNGRPGVAIAAGILPPWGRGAFTPPGWQGFGYVAVTESLLDEALLLHANLGLAVGDSGVAGAPAAILGTAGIGFQARIVRGLHGVAEVYYGDPYDPTTGFPAGQMGLRYIFSDHVQLDSTFGTTLGRISTPEGSRWEPWGTFGIRLVSPELW